MGVSCSKKKAIINIPPNPQIPDPPIETSNNLLFIITTFFNPAGFSRRIQLHQEFVSRLSDNPSIVVVTIECAFENQSFQVTTTNKSPLQMTSSINTPIEIQIRSNSNLWLKESLMNLALSYLKQEPRFNSFCKYVAWVDDDIEFSDPNFLQKLKSSLSQYTIVQMFRNALFLDINKKLLESFTSFGFYYATQNMMLTNEQYAHPGYAWATTKSKILQMGEFYDMGILGNGDKHMAAAIIGKYEDGFLKNYPMSDGYKQSLKYWQEKVSGVFEKKLGFVDMEIRHHWHGSKDDRQYMYRWKLLVDYQFDPLKDLTKENGVYWLNGKKEFQQKIQEVFKNRNEDEAVNSEFIEEKIPSEIKGGFNHKLYFEQNNKKIEKNIEKMNKNKKIKDSKGKKWTEDNEKPNFYQNVKEKIPLVKGKPNENKHYLMFFAGSEPEAQYVKREGFKGFINGVVLFKTFDLAKNRALKEKKEPIVVKTKVKFEDSKFRWLGIGEEECVIDGENVQFDKIVYLYENKQRKESSNGSCY